MTVAWRPNPTAPLWYEERRGEPVGPFFHDLSLQHAKQVGPSCVATTSASPSSPRPVLIRRASILNTGP